MVRKTTTPKTDDGIPAFLRVANDKGVSLSAGAAPVTAKAAKTAKTEKKAKEPKAEKPAKEAKAPKAPKATATTPAPALVVEDGELAEVEKVRRSIVPMKFKERYSKTGGTCGDDMALELKAATTTRNADKREVLDVEALWAIAKANGIDYSKYVDLNNGQKRMNVGNKLRGKLNQGGDVVIGKRQFKAEDWTPRQQ